MVQAWGQLEKLQKQGIHYKGLLAGMLAQQGWATLKHHADERRKDLARKLADFVAACARILDDIKQTKTATPKKVDELRTNLNAALEQVRQDGSYKRLGPVANSILRQISHFAHGVSNAMQVDLCTAPSSDAGCVLCHCCCHQPGKR